MKRPCSYQGQFIVEDCSRCSVLIGCHSDGRAACRPADATNRPTATTTSLGTCEPDSWPASLLQANGQTYRLCRSTWSLLSRRSDWLIARRSAAATVLSVSCRRRHHQRERRAAPTDALVCWLQLVNVNFMSTIIH